MVELGIRTMSLIQVKANKISKRLEVNPFKWIEGGRFWMEEEVGEIKIGYYIRGNQVEVVFSPNRFTYGVLS